MHTDVTANGRVSQSSIAPRLSDGAPTGLVRPMMVNPERAHERKPACDAVARLILNSNAFSSSPRGSGLEVEKASLNVDNMV